MTNLARSPEPVFHRLVRIAFGFLFVLPLAFPHALYAREVRVVLLHTADVRGHLQPLPQRELSEHTGGLLKAASLIEQVREEGQPVLLVDLGALFSGSLEAELSEGRLPARAAAWLRYDARLPDPTDLEASNALSESPVLGPVLLSNADSIPRSQRRSGAVVAHRVVEVEGVRVGFLGLDELTVPADPAFRLSHGEAGENLLRERLQELRAAAPQWIVLLLRCGPEPGRVRERAAELARRFPEIELILGGGDGEAVRSASWGRTVFSQAGRQARWVGRVDLLYDNVRGEASILSTDLLEAGPEVEVHRALSRQLGRELADTALESERVIGVNERMLDGTSRWPGQSGVQRLIGEAVATALAADVVMIEKQARAALSPGPVRVRDAFRLLPQKSQVATIHLTPAELRRVLEENAALLNSDAFLGIHGLTYRFSSSAGPGERIDEVLFSDGSRPHGRRRIRVALHAHLLEDLDRRPVLRELALLPESRLTHHASDTRRLVIDYIESRKVIDLRPQAGITVAQP